MALFIVGMVVFMVAIMLMFKPGSHQDTPAPRGQPATPPRAGVQPQPVQSPRKVMQPSQGATEKQLEQKLLSVLHDPARVERLAAARAKKMGRASRQEVLQAVYDDYLRDRR